MADQKLPAGSIVIDTITIKSDLGGDPWEIKNLVQEFSIYEAITEPFLTADMVVSDALSLTTIIPIVGQETVHIKFKTPHDSVIKSIDLEFRIASIENVVRSKPRMTNYIIHLASSEYFQNFMMRIEQSYRQKTISDMIKDIHSSYLVSKKTLNTSDTEGQRTIVIPSMKPTRAIEWLSQEAMSATYKPSNYMFYEDCNGEFNFKTADELISTTKTKEKYWAVIKDWQDPSRSPRDDAGTGAGGGARQSTKPYEMLKMTDFQFIQLFNADRVGVSGGWENTAYYIDPVYSEFTSYSYDYFTNYSDIRHTSGKGGGKFMSQDNTLISAKTSMENYFMTNKAGSNVDTDQKPNFFHIKAGSLGLLDNVLVEVTIPGDTDRRCGDLIDLQFPEFGATDDIEGKINRYVSGWYLVLGIRHIYNSDGYACVMQCAKNSYDQDALPSNPTENADEGIVTENIATFPDRPSIPTSTTTPLGPVWPNSGGEKV